VRHVLQHRPRGPDDVETDPTREVGLELRVPAARHLQRLVPAVGDAHQSDAAVRRRRDPLHEAALLEQGHELERARAGHLEVTGQLAQAHLRLAQHPQDRAVARCPVGEAGALHVLAQPMLEGGVRDGQHDTEVRRTVVHPAILGRTESGS